MSQGQSTAAGALSRRAFNQLLFGGAAALALAPGMQAFAQSNAGTLTVAVTTPPISLDPAKNGTGVNEIFLDPVYESLVRIDENGVVSPGLAESFEYIGEGNVAFEIKLRDGLTFTDGTPLDSSAVKTYLEYYVNAGGPFGAGAQAIETIETPDPLTVRLSLNAPVPNLIRQFSEGGLWGSIPNPKIVADSPDSLGNAMDGVGPYVLDASSVLGSEYIYVPNANYYDQSKIVWDRIVVRVIDNANSRFQALLSNQVDATVLDTGTAEAAKAAGMTVDFAPASWMGLWLDDRNGQVLPEMADVRFRKAINMAIDRATIAQALAAGYADPTQVATIPGRAGYDESVESLYPYDVEGAKALLAEAGISNVRFTALVPTFVPNLSSVAQAVASQLAAIGITVDIETVPVFPMFAEKSESGTFAAVFFEWGVADTYEALKQWILAAGVRNPFKTEHPEMVALMDKIAATPPNAAEEDYKALVRLVAEEAWFAPVLRTGLIFGHNQRVARVNNTLQFPNPVYIEPTGA